MKEINLRDFYPWYMEDVMAVHQGQPPPCLPQQGALLAGRRGRYRVFRLHLQPLSAGADRAHGTL